MNASPDAPGPLDPRIHPWRPDLAASSLRGRVAAARFVDGTDRQVCCGCAGLHKAADPASPLDSQLLYGETFTVYDEWGEWCWGQNGTDGYVGWVRGAALCPVEDSEKAGHAPTHRVAALRAFVQPLPGLKHPPGDVLSFLSPLCLIGEENGYGALAGGGWVSLRQVMPWGTVNPDYVATALRFLGTPYVWGGRSSLGIDCSGLVQTALMAAGLAAPRDSDQQRTTLGHSAGPVAADGRGFAFRRGDIVFFPGHVGIMLDSQQILHATAFVMETTVEPLEAVAQRTDPTRGGGVLAVRRIG